MERSAQAHADYQAIGRDLGSKPIKLTNASDGPP
jgi:hypothetical protein